MQSLKRNPPPCGLCVGLLAGCPGTLPQIKGGLGSQRRILGCFEKSVDSRHGGCLRGSTSKGTKGFLEFTGFKIWVCFRSILTTDREDAHLVTSSVHQKLEVSELQRVRGSWTLQSQTTPQILNPKPSGSRTKYQFTSLLQGPAQ